MTTKTKKKKSVTDGLMDQPTDQWTDRPTKRGVESRSRRLKTSVCFGTKTRDLDILFSFFFVEYNNKLFE